MGLKRQVGPYEVIYITGGVGVMYHREPERVLWPPRRYGSKAKQKKRVVNSGCNGYHVSRTWSEVYEQIRKQNEVSEEPALQEIEALAYNLMEG